MPYYRFHTAAMSHIFVYFNSTLKYVLQLMTNKVNNDDRVFFPLQKEFSWIALYSRCNETENKRQLCMLLVAEP